jgi:molybdopterin synthase catalytic subunit
VTALQYEAYEEEAQRRLPLIASEARRKWPSLGRLVLLHRLGRVRVGESAVVVVASAPHRDEAFAAARFGIDEAKATLPIWKHEWWEGGHGWSAQAQPAVGVRAPGG